MLMVLRRSCWPTASTAKHDVTVVHAIMTMQAEKGPKRCKKNSIFPRNHAQFLPESGSCVESLTCTHRQRRVGLLRGGVGVFRSEKADGGALVLGEIALHHSENVDGPQPHVGGIQTLRIVNWHSIFTEK